MFVEGIDGAVEESNHPQWIECNSMSFSAVREAETTVGQGGNRQGRHVSVSDITVTKPMEASSPHLWLSSLTSLGKKVRLHITRTGEDKSLNFLEMTLDKVFFSNYSLSSDQDNHTESVSLNFLKMELKYIPVDKDGKAGTPIPVSFDALTGEVNG
jgi:type VI secretion system secreted protein Hcp